LRRSAVRRVTKRLLNARNDLNALGVTIEIQQRKVVAIAEVKVEYEKPGTDLCPAR